MIITLGDYINILANHRNPNTENTYMKIKQIAEDLRGMAVRRDYLVVSATQVNRCLAKDSILLSKNKGNIKIEDVEIGDEILSHKGYVKVINKSEREIKKGLKIKTESGKEIIVSRNHRFPVGNNLKYAYELKKGDKLYRLES